MANPNAVLVLEKDANEAHHVRVICDFGLGPDCTAIEGLLDAHHSGEFQRLFEDNEALKAAHSSLMTEFEALQQENATLKAALDHAVATYQASVEHPGEPEHAEPTPETPATETPTDEHTTA